MESTTPKGSAAARPARALPAAVVVAEDDDDDFLLTTKALEDYLGDRAVTRARNGEELMAVLESLVNGARSDQRLPLIILLDLNMPRLDGREGLRLIRAHPRFKRIPVIVLSNSSSPQDISLAYELGANSYLAKPAGFKQFVAIIGRVAQYWLETVELPTWGDA